MKNILVIHFGALELYPPIQNLLRVLNERIENVNVFVLTNEKASVELSTFHLESSRIKILRSRIGHDSSRAVSRYFGYLYFYLFCLYYVIRYSPQTVLYFETLSSFPVYIYKRFFNRRAAVYVHYHEYTGLEEYESGMTLVRWFHHLEKWLYARAAWVSHTNQERLERFRLDNSPVAIVNGFVLPNYPPKSWMRPPSPIKELPIRVVYAGALSLHSMYTRLFAEWVLLQNGNVVWDIYTHNCTKDARNYILALNSPLITLKGGVNYSDLPLYLVNYDVGVILYNGHIPNYIYNAPNKLFEYWACGLAVWFPDVMVGSMPYVTQGTFPEIVALDFASLNSLKPSDFITRECFEMKACSYYCEDALKGLFDQLLR